MKKKIISISFNPKLTHVDRGGRITRFKIKEEIELDEKGKKYLLEMLENQKEKKK